MPRHREKVRELSGLDGTGIARYPGRTPYRPEIELKCVKCGRGMKVAGWWMAGEMTALITNHPVELECDDGHSYEVPGRWLWKQIYDASENGYTHVTISHKFLARL